MSFGKMSYRFRLSTQPPRILRYNQVFCLYKLQTPWACADVDLTPNILQHRHHENIKNDSCLSHPIASSRTRCNATRKILGPAIESHPTFRRSVISPSDETGPDPTLSVRSQKARSHAYCSSCRLRGSRSCCDRRDSFLVFLGMGKIQRKRKPD